MLNIESTEPAAITMSCLLFKRASEQGFHCLETFTLGYFDRSINSIAFWGAESQHLQHPGLGRSEQTVHACCSFPITYLLLSFSLNDFAHLAAPLVALLLLSCFSKEFPHSEHNGEVSCLLSPPSLIPRNMGISHLEACR